MDALGSDASLLAGLRSGDEAAFVELVDRYGGRMRATALRLLGSPDSADDAVQDAFLFAFRSLDDFEARSSIGTWLHRVTINAALTKRRGAQRQSDLESDI